MLKVICTDNSNTKFLVLNKEYKVKRISKDKIMVFDDNQCTYSINRFKLVNFKLDDLGKDTYYINKRINYKFDIGCYYVCYKDYKNVKKGQVFKYHKDMERWYCDFMINELGEKISINQNRFKKHFYMIDEQEYFSLIRKNKIKKIIN
ncbi:MAG: hypothetical protein ACOC3V_02655 [bacterium]